MGFRVTMIENIRERQIQLERTASAYSYDRLINQINRRIEQDQADDLQEGKLILINSIEAVSAKLDEYMEKKITGKMKAARDIIALDFYGKTKDLAYVILATIVRSISKEIQIPVLSLVRKINTAVYETILIRRLHDSDSNFGAFVDKRYANRSEVFRTKEKLKMARLQQRLNETELDSLTTYLGTTLINLVIKSGCNIIEQKTVYHNRKKAAKIMYTDECFKMVLQSREKLLTEYRRYPILLTKPVEWNSFIGSGGYITKELYAMPIIKAQARSKDLLHNFFDKSDTQAVYDTLNTLQATKWRINKKVYEVMSKIYDDNIVDESAPYNNPYLIGKLPYNDSLEPEDFINVANYGELYTEGKYKGWPKEKIQRTKYFKDLEAQRDIVISNRGKAIMTNLILFNAREYLDEEEFYFSYQYDFRGRIYPIQQHLQPQGKGEVKALLEFKDGCKIETEEELEWFLIHGANCYGYDKDEYVDRISKMRDKEEEIKLVAENPLKYRMYWKDSADPYLYLAWCFEYADYLNNPNDFVSRIPIALDATCSGIQIYSGLLKDREGAKAVNVIGDKRSDIYQEVADKVNHYLEVGEYPKIIDYTTSNKEVHQAYTQPTIDSVKGKITRSLTKRNTMTQPYSVTKYGMYEQLKETLTELEQANKKFWIGDNWLFAKILTDLNDRAIAEVVQGARVGQNYLKEVVADKVSKGGYVFFTAPITQFPVLQKLHKTQVDRIITPIGKLSIKRTIDEMNHLKMQNGIAPNYIHSLDASLLAYTVLKLKDDGCSSFHLIHDSYGVPVNHVVNLNKRVREAFIEIFETNPLALFLSQVNKDYPVKAEDVMINTLDLKEVLDSKYIFS